MTTTALEQYVSATLARAPRITDAKREDVRRALLTGARR